MDQNNFEELVRDSVRELLERREDISRIRDVSIGIPLQPDFQITEKPAQELKFYCPLTIRQEPDYDDEYIDFQSTKIMENASELIAAVIERNASIKIKQFRRLKNS